jgi:uncharacterized protein YbjT (DUF2867 family)
MKSQSLESLLSDKRILILGASGQIGRQVTASLRRLAPGSHLLLQSRQIQSGSGNWLQFSPQDQHWPQMGHFDLIINLAGAMHALQGEGLEKLHLGIANGILRHLEALGNPRLIHISALNAAKGHRSKFLHSKGLSDEILLEHPNTMVLRPSIVCTNGTVLAQKLKQMLQVAKIALGKLMVPKGFLATKVQPIMGGDLAEAIIRLAAMPEWKGKRVHELGGPKAVEFGELTKIMAEAKGQNFRVVELPKEILEGFVRYFMDVWAPSILSLDQYFLLFEDNICSSEDLEAILGRPATDTQAFWEREALSLAATEDLPEMQPIWA